MFGFFAFWVGIGEVLNGLLLAALISTGFGGGASSSVTRIPKLENTFSEWATKLEDPAFLGIVCAISLLTTNLFAIGLFRIKARLLYGTLHHFRCLLLEGFFSREYTFYSKSHSSSAIAMITSETQRLFHSALSPAANLLQFLPTVIVLVISIFWVNPHAGGLACAVFFPSYGLYYFCLRPFFRRRGKILHESSKGRQKTLQEGFGAIRELFFWGKRKLFVEEFVRTDKNDSEGEARSYFLSAIPRNGLEICMVIFALITFAVISQNGSLKVSVAQLIFFGFAALRLLPALQMTFFAFAGLEIGRRGLEEVVGVLEQEAGRKRQATLGIPLPLSAFGPPVESVELRHISYGYGAGRSRALKNLSICVPAGSLTAIIGPTGAGKSTAVDILAGLLVPEEGGVWVDGREISPSEFPAWRRQLAYLPQHPYLLDASVRDNIALGSHGLKIDQERVVEAARSAQIDKFIRTLPLGYDEPMGERGVRLSGGQRQRLGLARALYSRAPVLLLDEPTSALDMRTESEIMETLLEIKGKHTIVLVTHRETAWRRCDIVYLIDKGTAKKTYPACEIISLKL